MAIPKTWQPIHRHDDGELLGWVEAIDDGRFIARDRLGWVVGEADTVDESEDHLGARGLGWLGEAFAYTAEVGAEPVRVRLVEVSTDRVVVKADDWGAIDVPTEQFVLRFPVPREMLHPWH